MWYTHTHRHKQRSHKESYAPNLIQASEWFTALLLSVVRHAKCKLCRYNTAGYPYDWIIFLSSGVRVFSPNTWYDKPLNCSFCGLHNQNLIPNRDRVFVPLWLTVTPSHLYQGLQEFLPCSMVNPSYVMETNECTLFKLFYFNS